MMSATLQQGHDNVFTSHGYFQISELIHERLNLVDMVQQVITLLHFTYEKLAVDKNNGLQTFRLVNVAKGLPRLRKSLTTLDVCKLVVCEVEADDGHDLLHTALIHLQHFGIYIERWRFFGSVHNIPKIHECQQHFDFKLPKIELPFIEFVNDSSGLAFT